MSPPPGRPGEIRFLWFRFTLREALLLAFCATFVVVTRATLRLRLGLPGHAMFFLMFFLLLARAAVPRLGAATLVGFVASLVVVLLGMTKAGPLVIVNLLLPAMLVDLAAFVLPALPGNVLACVLVGAIASAARATSAAILDVALGMERELIVRHVAFVAAAGAGFGAAGAALVPPIVRRLRASRLIPG